MKLDDQQIKEILIKENYISEDDALLAQEYADSHNSSVTEYLFNEGLLSKDIYGQAIAEFFGVSYADLKTEKIDGDLLELIPEIVARNRGVVAFSRTEDGVKIGMINPSDLEIVHFVEKAVGERVIPFFITEQDFSQALAQYKAGLQDTFELIINSLSNDKLSRDEKDKTIVEMVDIMLQYGNDAKVSDIHIEPYEKKIVVRFRIDGVLHNILEIPKDLVEFILTRIKILAKMRTDEHRAAQDGKLRFKSGEENVDVRVSIVPSTKGETVVMRLLSAKSRQFGLADIGLNGAGLKVINQGIKHPHGMILVTGPTGSGKTTTLYSILKILNKEEINIATIEDPVEYDIAGITQIQVNTKTDLTFAKGLRALVRQDPDIIMVGEIRDEETASIAVNSALTGHLVLSTLHTNDAATTLPRLLDMKVEPFLVASTINIVIAQRLVRKICSKCKVSYSITNEEFMLLSKEQSMKDIYLKKGHKNLKKLRLYKGKGCKNCTNTGFMGRIGLFEILVMEENIKDLILSRASSDEIQKKAKQNGMVTMMEDGIDKVLNGSTTIQEVLRVTRE